MREEVRRLTRKQAAKFLGMSVSRLGQWVSEDRKRGQPNRLPFCVFKNKVLYTLEDLENYKLNVLKSK